jgi:hypothetical protein
VRSGTALVDAEALRRLADDAVFGEAVAIAEAEEQRWLALDTEGEDDHA